MKLTKKQLQLMIQLLVKKIVTSNELNERNYLYDNNDSYLLYNLIKYFAKKNDYLFFDLNYCKFNDATCPAIRGNILDITYDLKLANIDYNYLIHRNKKDLNLGFVYFTSIVGK